MPDYPWLRILDRTCESLQQLDKVLRRARNKGECQPADVASVKKALAEIRAIYDRNKISDRPDIDSRGERHGD